MKKVLITGALIIIAFILILQWIPLGIEPLTELYFENHTALRANSFPEEEYNFSFTIHNLEYQTMAYNYNISAFNTEDNLILELDSGRISLTDNQSTTLQGNYNLSKGFDRAKVLVTIEKDHLGIIPDFKNKLWWPDPNYPNQIEIHFWTDEIKPIQIIHIPD